MNYRIPVRYVHFLDCPIHGNLLISDCRIENAVLTAMDIELENRPDDFPSTDHLVAKAKLLKNNIVKQCGRSSKYVIPENYVATMQKLLEEDTKVKDEVAQKALYFQNCIEKGSEPKDCPMEKNVKTVFAAMHKKIAEEQRSENMSCLRRRSRPSRTNFRRMVQCVQRLWKV